MSLSSASTETPDAAAQYIYIQEAWLPKFLAVFIRNGWWIDLQYIGKVEQWRLRFAINVDLRRDLPTALHGKFSIKP
jgi:hypothetical protein